MNDRNLHLAFVGKTAYYKIFRTVYIIFFDMPADHLHKFLAVATSLSGTDASYSGKFLDIHRIRGCHSLK